MKMVYELKRRKATKEEIARSEKLDKILSTILFVFIAMAGMQNFSFGLQLAQLYEPKGIIMMITGAILTYLCFSKAGELTQKSFSKEENKK
jgi:hypothetical protein